MPTHFWQGARKHQSLDVCITKTARNFLKRNQGQPFTFFDMLTYVIANGDFALYDRWVKSFDPDTQITDAESYIDWVAKRNPEVANAIRLKDIETFGNMIEDAEAEPTLFSEGYCPRARGGGRLGDCCNS
jgi:hypothetical protein